jgi:hypothetical protein
VKKKSTARPVDTDSPSGSDVTSRSARRVLSGGRRGRRSKSWEPATYDVDDLVAAVTPLLELFSMLDAVFTEDEALTTHSRMSLGRCYEAWQTCRKTFDPGFVAAEHRKPRRAWKIKE